MQELKKKVQKVRDLENEYRKCCHVAKAGENAKNAFLEWINTVLILFSDFYPADHTDYNWIRSQDFTGNGYNLYKVYVNISQKCSRMLAEIESGKAPLPEQKANNKEKPKKPLVFISHKSSQENFVKALVILLESCGFTKDNLFCSSVPGFHIGLDEDIIETLRKKFVDYDLYVVYVFSTDFFQSAYCLNEMGAAWVLQKTNSIIITSGTDESIIEGVVDKNKTRVSFNNIDGMLSVRMIELRDKLLEFAGLPKVNEIDWIRHYDTFLNQVGVKANASITMVKTNTKSQSSLVIGNPYTIVMDSIRKLGLFTIKELQEETGIQSNSYLSQIIEALVRKGDLIVEGNTLNRKYRLKV